MADNPSQNIEKERRNLSNTSPVLGQWPEAPLALVLAQIRFESFMDLDTAASPFRDRIEKLYPRIQPFHALSFPFASADGTPPDPTRLAVAGYDFHNADQTKCVRLELGALTYFVTSYEQYQGHFEEDWASLVLALSPSKDLFVTRAGLRYIDFIVPTTGAHPNDYVQEPLGRAPTVADGSPTTTFNMLQYAMKEGVMRIQYSQASGKMELPPDLQSVQLAPSPVMLKEHKALGAILDTDRWVEPAASLPSPQIKALFSMMHNDMSTAFKSIITTRALNEWACQ